ncbi:chemotaxis protein CheX [Coralloluteibacterium stylophorae]|uniref:Chemotaxis protein CheX n=1 Tax=Coralloluteibacterium stylophorae TaxID=1776034 RepID=A0AAP2FYB0_9GAMM|nr:chemotaxis protein CheX [Coralloluteibacterium stylophorae]MBS7456959.1 chemotaxis protein CheX [Coralloluteibacterium stylophorae]
MAAKFLGQFLLEKGAITREQLLAALDAQQASNPLLGELAEQRGLLTATQARRINERQRAEDRRFGDIAVEMGLLDAAQVDALVAAQKAQRKLFGEILIEQGTLTRDELEAELAAHQADRDDAIRAVELHTAGHALGDVAGAAIETCARLFPRILGTPAMVSKLVESAADLDDCDVTAHVRIESERPLVVALACGRETMRRIGCAFLSIGPGECDAELALDALGELVNVLMGYVVRDALPADASYRAAPPSSLLPATQLLADGALAVALHSKLGPFVLLVGR